MSLQSLFDTAVAGLAKQGFVRSVNELGHCSFRGKDGLKCAIGHCLDDNEIVIIDECEQSYKTNARASAKYGVTDSDIGWLQSCHDSMSGPEEMKAALRLFAKEHKLILPAVLQQESTTQ